MPLNITLEDDEALVLFDLLASGKLDAVVDAPQRDALSAVEALLERQLVQPFQQHYDELVVAARESIIKRLGP